MTLVYQTEPGEPGYEEVAQFRVCNVVEVGRISQNKVNTGRRDMGEVTCIAARNIPAQRKCSGVVLAQAPRFNLVSHNIYDTDSFCPFGPTQRSWELLEPCFDRVHVGRDLRPTRNRFRAMVVLPVAEEAEFEDHVAPLQAVAGALLIGRVARPQRKRLTDPKYSERDEDEMLDVRHSFSPLLRSGGREARRRAIASRPNRRENEKRRTTLQRLRTA